MLDRDARARGSEREARHRADAGDTAARARAYAALGDGAMLVNRGARGRMVMGGEKAAAVLTGLVTNDVLALAPGQGLYAAALSPKGKIIADVRLFARHDGFLIDIPERAIPGFWAMIRKYVNPRLADYRDTSASTGHLAVFGARAYQLVSGGCGIDAAVLATLPPYGHRDVERAGAQIMVVRATELGVEGYELFADRATVEALRQRLLAAGATADAGEAFETARIEAGRPEWGVDIDDTTLAQEANLDALHAISYTKGCYTGQETVARVHFRGHVNRLLRGLTFDARARMELGAVLQDAAGQPMGDVRSTAVSPRRGGIALAMVRREVETGGSLRAAWPGGSTPVTVVPLPFPA